MEALGKYPLKAVMIDGVFPQVCSDERDPPQIVNIKKGILSAIQNSFATNSSVKFTDAVKLTEVSPLA